MMTLNRRTRKSIPFQTGTLVLQLRRVAMKVRGVAGVPLSDLATFMMKSTMSPLLLVADDQTS